MQTNGNAITWEEPPPSGKRRKIMATDPLVAELKANHGRWARLAEYAKDNSAGEFAKRVNEGGSLWCQPAGSFEATCRRVNGTSVVYARYVGEPVDTVDTLLDRARQIADRIEFDFRSNMVDAEHPVAVVVWFGDVCEDATAATPAEALAAAIEKLSAYLTGGAS